MKNTIYLLVTLFIAVSCSSRSEKGSAEISDSRPVNVDSLMESFLSGWNNKDSVAIMNTIAADAVVMNDSLIHRGHDQISSGWISGGVKVLSNIKTNSIVKRSGSTIAFDGGTYSLDLTIPGGPVLKERGNYNLIWEKQGDGTWKLTLIHIEDITRMPDVQKGS